MARPAPMPFKYRAELWLARWTRRWYGLRRRELEPAPPAAFSLRASGLPGVPAAPHPRAIPPILWAYWSGGTPPLLVERCFVQWRRLHPGFEVRILDADTVRHYVPDIPPALASAAIAKQSDWLRLELLRRYGGIWLDASTILTAPLDWVLAEQARTGADYLGYYLERFTTVPERPVVESWFMAAPAGSPFIEDLQREFTDEVITRTGQGYIDHLRAQGLYEQVCQRIEPPDYLSIHLAMQVVLLRGGAYRLLLAKAEDGPFYYHRLGRWGRTALKMRILFARIGTELPAIVKLRAPDRRRLDDYLARGLYLPDSLVGHLLMADANPPATGPSPTPSPTGDLAP
jgi:hypothetical protein